MQTIRVAVQDLSDAYLIRVDSLPEATWLLARLSHAFVFKSASDVQRAAGSLDYTFEIPALPWLTCDRLKELLAAMPRVSLISAPATAVSL